MQKVISESRDRKRRIVIDPSSKTVTFINCHILTPPSFFTLRILRQAEVVCPFADILDVFKMRGTNKWTLLGPPPQLFRIATASGDACFSTHWSNFDEARSVLKEISASTTDAPVLRNPNIGAVLLILGCAIATAIIAGLYFWLTWN